MPDLLPDNGGPTAAEIFGVFRNTTMATIAALKLLLEECADLRAELVTMTDVNHGGSGLFCDRQRNRILQLEGAAQEMKALLASLPGEEDGDGV